ncbi:hypothetical protein GCM10023321_45150 [Pseudonocardia eucalypti]|uniref:Cation/H+ exchanger transmembrane domain-containing protein n=1 Tax=Pseudonocardia eucalypti TaxID=648755 RepID=A0ABP9QFR4_9PSEU
MVTAHVLAVTVVVLALARLGGAAAKLVASDKVIGEIAVGLAAIPTLSFIAGPDLPRLLAPSQVMAGVGALAEAGLVLFLVGLAHGLRSGLRGRERLAVRRVAFVGYVVPLCLGGLLGAWLLAHGGAEQRGTASKTAFVLFVAVAMAITAVPVLSRILADRELDDTSVGKVSLGAAIVMDVAGWLMLSVAVSLTVGSPAASVRSMSMLVGGALLALLLRRVLQADAVDQMAGRYRSPAMAVVAIIALVVAHFTHQAGLTAILGAVLVVVAIPMSGVWPSIVSGISRRARPLVPLYFATAGFSVLSAAPTVPPWSLVTLVLVVAVVGKVGGGYLGARLGGQNTWDAARTGALMNTRGLTELLVLQVGYSTNIISATLYLAILPMTLVTTASTGPALAMIGRLERRRREKDLAARSTPVDTPAPEL